MANSRTLRQPIRTRGVLGRVADLLRGADAGGPSVAEARARIRARPGFYASLTPAARAALARAEEPAASGPPSEA
jgi:hypothetical protein